MVRLKNLRFSLCAELVFAEREAFINLRRFGFVSTSSGIRGALSGIPELYRYSLNTGASSCVNPSKRTHFKDQTRPLVCYCNYESSEGCLWPGSGIMPRSG